eukprot:gene6793-9306_t
MDVVFGDDSIAGIMTPTLFFTADWARKNMSLDQLIDEKNSRKNGRTNNSKSFKVKGSVVNRKDRNLHASSPYDNDRRKQPTYRSNTLHQSDEKDIALKFLLPNFFISSLIGNKGQSKQQVIDITGANVLISGANEFFPNTHHRIVYINGNISEVNLTQALIWEMIGQQQYASNSETRIEWDPIEANNSPGAYDDIQVECQLAIPASAAGLIIGKGGNTIRTIIEESGAALVMDKKGETDGITNERVLTISGTMASCMNCTSLILQKFNDSEEFYTYEFNGTSYSMLFSSNNNSTAYAVNSVQSKFRGSYDGRNTLGSTSHDSGDVTLKSSKNVSHVSGGEAIETLSANTVIELAVPDSMVGYILGLQGSALSNIISLSGAKVKLSKRGDYVEGTTNRLVTITGTPACAQTAHTLIVHKIKQSMHDD